MRIVKWLLGIVVVLAAALLVGGMLISPKFAVSRSTVIDAPPEKVYPLIASPRQWKEWTVWNRRDPAMQIDYLGPPSGAGAGWSWKSKTEGDGRMVFSAAEPDRRVVYELVFPEFDMKSTGALSLVPDGATTRVTWSMEGDAGGNPMYRWFALMMDSMVGKDFEGGLANLKALSEKKS